MLEFDEEKVADMILSEWKRGERERYTAKAMARNLKDVEICLIPEVEIWLRGRHPQFEFNGVTLDEILPLYRNYVGAILHMDKMIKNNETAEDFREDVEYLRNVRIK
jgi:hypothetical protein